MTKAAVLVNYTLHAFVNERSDKKIAAEVAANHGAASGTGKYLKERLPPSVLMPINQITSKAYQFHCRMTAPWLDRGIRMMPAKLILPYESEIKMFQGELQQEVTRLCGQLTHIDMEAKRLRGTLYSADLIPSADTLRNAWQIDIELLPVPLVDDFRVDYIGNHHKKKFIKNSQARTDKQSQHVKELMLIPLLRLENTFFTDSPRVRASTMEQLTWICDHAGEVALDEVLGAQMADYAKKIKLNILEHYDPEGRPKFDLEFIEEAMEIISEVKVAFDKNWHTTKTGKKHYAKS